jgi:hypothetical protein
VLVLLKIPPEPQPPVGDPGSLRVFHAGRNYFRLRLAGWAVGQLLALGGIVFWTGMLLEVETAARADVVAPVARPIRPAASGAAGAAARPDRGAPSAGERFAHRVKQIVASADRATEAAKKEGRAKTWAGYKQVLVEIGRLVPDRAYVFLWALKLIGFAAYLAQIPITYAVRRLDYEMRWYMVTDRSLRVRHGVWQVAETTMSFANLQQVTVSRGPIQGLLGLADVDVQSAGGGTGDEYRAHRGQDMHLVRFHCVTNAEEIRDLILERLRRFRDSGLGDPGDGAVAGGSIAPVAAEATAITREPAPEPALLAARELLAEARALRTQWRDDRMGSAVGKADGRRSA